MSPQQEPTAQPPRRHRVVIIGSGFGGLNAAKKLKRADVDIKLIARTTHHLFQPLLYQVATGIISEGEIAPPTRVVLRKQRNVQVLLGNVTHIDLAGQCVVSELLGHTYQTPYDSLIVAAGAGQSYFGNDHFAEFAPGMKSIDDALELRGRILSAFEQAERSSDPERRAKLLTFTVVGAGPTGVEMAGQIAELAEHTLKGAFRHIDSTKARVILLDAAIQGAKYVASTIKAELAGANPAEREPFQYFDKGSMATVSRFSAVAKIGPVEFSGFIAWLIWLVLHLAYLIGFKTKITTLLSWTVTFLSTRRGQLTITDQQAFARTRLEQLAELAAEAQGSAASAKVAS